jgi:hypothetical protein
MQKAVATVGRQIGDKDLANELAQSAPELTKRLALRLDENKVNQRQKANVRPPPPPPLRLTSNGSLALQ